MPRNYPVSRLTRKLWPPDINSKQRFDSFQIFVHLIPFFSTEKIGNANESAAALNKIAVFWHPSNAREKGIPYNGIGISTKSRRERTEIIKDFLKAFFWNVRGVQNPSVILQAVRYVAKRSADCGYWLEHQFVNERCCTKQNCTSTDCCAGGKKNFCALAHDIK